MLKEQLIERTDFSQPRPEFGWRSLTRWHDFEVDRLVAEQRVFDEELQRTDDPVHQLELQQALRENEVERAALDTGWQNSSLRRKLTPEQNEQEAAIHNTGGVERRLSSVSAAGNSLLQSEPGTGNKKGSQTKLVGYAALYDKDSLDLGGFTEVILPGAFNEVIKTCDCRFLVNHNSDLILARTKSKTLRLYSDDFGLKFYADMLPDDFMSEGIAARVQRGDISSCSFSFVVGKDKWEFAKRPGEIDRRIIISIAELFDVGCVVYPAYKETTVSVLYEKRELKNTDTSGCDDDDDDQWQAVCRNRDLADLEERIKKYKPAIEIERKYRKAMGR